MKRYLYSGFAGLMVMLLAFSLSAHEGEAGHSHEKAERHGGSVVMTQNHHFEVVPMMRGIAVFAYDINQNPVPVKGVTGTAKVMLRSGKTMSIDLKPYSSMQGQMMGSNSSSGMMQNKSGGMSKDNSNQSFFGMKSMMWGNIDLSKLDANEAKVSVDLKGLHDKSESNVDFRETMHLTNLPKTMQQAMAMAKEHHHDEEEDEHGMHSDHDEHQHGMMNN